MTDDVHSLRFAWLTNGKVPPSGLKPHDDLLAHFPHTGPPTPDRVSPRPQRPSDEDRNTTVRSG
jgi:hypothetical protein